MISLKILANKVCPHLAKVEKLFLFANISIALNKPYIVLKKLLHDLKPGCSGYMVLQSPLYCKVLGKNSFYLAVLAKVVLK